MHMYVKCILQILGQPLKKVENTPHSHTAWESAILRWRNWAPDTGWTSRAGHSGARLSFLAGKRCFCFVLFTSSHGQSLHPWPYFECRVGQPTVITSAASSPLGPFTKWLPLAVSLPLSVHARSIWKPDFKDKNHRSSSCSHLSPMPDKVPGSESFMKEWKKKSG